MGNFIRSKQAPRPFAACFAISLGRSILAETHRCAVGGVSSVFEDDGSLSPLTMIVTEKGRLEGYFALRSIENGEPMDPPESGALVPRRFWEYYGDRMKDGVTVFDTGLNRCRLQVAGVFENYYGQLFFLTPQSYEEVFGQAPVNNCFFVRSGSLSPTELQKLLERGVTNGVTGTETEE